MSTVTVRIATVDDIPGMLDVQKMSPEASQWNSATYHNLLTVQNRQTGGWVAFKDHKIIGLLLFQKPTDDELEILNLAVNPDARRCGVGTKLLKQLLLDRKGQIFIEVRSSNQRATKFYRRWGFVYVDLRKRYYNNPSDDALVMALRIP